MDIDTHEDNPWVWAVDVPRLYPDRGISAGTLNKACSRGTLPHRLELHPIFGREMVQIKLSDVREYMRTFRPRPRRKDVPGWQQPRREA